ncbi:MAG: S8 family peptidase [Bacillota bacterium]
MKKIKFIGLIFIILSFIMIISGCDYLNDNTSDFSVELSMIDISFNVKVISVTGSGISDIKLTLEKENNNIYGSTDDSGDYLFENLVLEEGKIYLIKAEHPGYVNESKSFTASKDLIQIKFVLNEEDLEIDPDDENDQNEENDDSVNRATINGNIEVKHNFPGAKVDLDSKDLIDISGFAVEKPDELVIKFDKSLSQAEREEILVNNGLEKVDQIKKLNLVLVRLPEVSSLDDSINNLEKLSGIDYIDSNYRIEGLDTRIPNDEKYSQQWNYPLIRLPQAWVNSTGSNNIRVALLDTGVDYNHPELQGKIDLKGAYNIIDDNTEVFDSQGHGTHVAGIIGAVTNNQQGIAGIMWDVDLVPVRILDDKGEGDIWDVAKGLLYAAGLLDENLINEPVDIINLSVGSIANPAYLDEAIEEVAAKNIIMVAASGNSGNKFIFYPANYSQVIAVGSIDYGGLETPTKSSFSSYGGNLDFVAPGKSIYSILPDGRYGSRSGTSMAAPHVTGVAGLMLANGISPQDVRRVMQETAISLSGEDFDNEYGYGLINSYWAVNNIQDLRIIIGERNKEIIKIVKEKSMSLKGGNFTVENIPAGKHQVIAWIDLDRDGLVSYGDYYGESNFIDFVNNKNYNLSGEIGEVGFDIIGLELNKNLISVID